jgi:hypothetical protein
LVSLAADLTSATPSHWVKKSAMAALARVDLVGGAELVLLGQAEGDVVRHRAPHQVGEARGHLPRIEAHQRPLADHRLGGDLPAVQELRRHQHRRDDQADRRGEVPRVGGALGRVEVGQALELVGRQRAAEGPLAEAGDEGLGAGVLLGGAGRDRLAGQEGVQLAGGGGGQGLGGLQQVGGVGVRDGAADEEARLAGLGVRGEGRGRRAGVAQQVADGVVVLEAVQAPEGGVAGGIGARGRVDASAPRAAHRRAAALAARRDTDVAGSIAAARSVAPFTNLAGARGAQQRDGGYELPWPEGSAHGIRTSFGAIPGSGGARAVHRVHH